MIDCEFAERRLLHDGLFLNVLTVDCHMTDCGCEFAERGLPHDGLFLNVLTVYCHMTDCDCELTVDSLD